MRTTSTIIAITATLVLGVWVAIEVSPWPSALAIRYLFDSDAWRTNAALAGRVPAGVEARRNESYHPGEPDARLDVFYPAVAHAEHRALLTIVWIHGGAFLSGSKDQITNYAQILAAGGYTVVTVDYSLAPERQYPTPLRQLNAAPTYLQENAAWLHVDPQRFVVAGDSAGALLAAQVANIVVPTHGALVIQWAGGLRERPAPGNACGGELPNAAISAELHFRRQCRPAVAAVTCAGGSAQGPRRSRG